MNRDGTIRYEFATELPQQPSRRHGVPVWGRATGVIEGRCDPTRAAAAFDASRQKPLEELGEIVRQNVLGWANYAAGEMFRRWAAEQDIVQLVLNPAACHQPFIELLKPQFDPWTFAISGLQVTFTLDPGAVAGLPGPAQAQLSAAIGPPPGSSPAPAAGPPGSLVVEHQFSGDIPPVNDPMTKFELKVRCSASVTLVIDPRRATEALEQPADVATERLRREATAKAEEWFWYGVKQAFFNWIFDSAMTHRRFVRDYSLIHPHVMKLCEPGLANLGITVKEARVRYEALDSDSAWALTAPGQSGSAPAVGSASPPTPVASQGDPDSGQQQARIEPPAGRASSEQAMAATIAVMSVDDLPVVGGTPGDPASMPPIEEAVWRHQKRVMKNNPGMSRADCAVQVLAALKADGYTQDDRRRIASIIGADPASVID